MEDKLRMLRKRIAHLSWADRRRWFTNSQQQAFSILPNEVTIYATVTQKYDFAIAVHEVTQANYQKFKASKTRSKTSWSNPQQRVRR